MTLERLPTGIPGLDEVTHGGLPHGGIYLVIGRPGAGKSIFGNQLAYAHAKRGGKAVYATLLSETHARLLTQIRQLSFFDETAIGTSIVYLNALAPLEAGGLDELLKTLQHMVRKQDAELLVLDGLLPPAQLGVDEITYKKFVAALQAWVGVLGCTVLILKTGPVESTPSAEQTMVDGIVELGFEVERMRQLRRLSVTKLRGTSFVEGKHAYRIRDAGMEVFPRIEATLHPDPGKTQPLDSRVATGIPGLDALLDGGVVRGSNTLFLGPSGSGKTTSLLQFALAAARAGERTLFFGFYEPEEVLRHSAKRLGHPVADYEASGALTFMWRDPADPMLDREAQALVDAVRAKKITCVAFDGFAALRRADDVPRIAQVFAALSNAFSRDGITMLVTDESRDLFSREVNVPTENVSAIFHNILFLRQIERGAELARLIGVMKTRSSAHDRRLWELEIGDQGIRVTQPFAANASGLLRGGGEANG